ncbi:hypothetical protein D3C79_724490 [compost metagenome]
MKTGKHEEGGAVDPRPQGQAQLGIGLVIFIGLQDQKGDAQYDGQPQPELQCATVILAQGMVRNGHGDTGADQQDGVDQRQVPRVDDVLGRRKQFRVGCIEQRPGKLEIRPEHVCDTFGTFTAQPGPSQVAHIKQRTEEGDEEHHLRKDEPRHPPAERAVQLRAVQPGATLFDHRAKPAEEHVRQTQRAEEKDPRAMGIRSPSLEVVEPGAQAKHCNEHADSGNDRPLALRRNVIVLMRSH